MRTEVSKAAVHYQTTPKDGKKCSGCTMFLPKDYPTGCTLVMGIISANGYCVEHDPK